MLTCSLSLTRMKLASFALQRRGISNVVLLNKAKACESSGSTESQKLYVNSLKFYLIIFVKFYA